MVLNALSAKKSMNETMVEREKQRERENGIEPTECSITAHSFFT